ALHIAGRGLKVRMSLADLLQRHRGARNRKNLPRLTERRILDWANAHHAETGTWPNENSGEVSGAPGEAWGHINQALRQGLRGLRGDDTLAHLVARRVGARNNTNVPPLSIAQVLAWADAHHERTGHWPNADTGAITESSDDTWMAIDNALRAGVRGLERGQSLARLLHRERGVRNRQAPPRLTVQQILAA